MTGKAVVVGIDGSPASARAAAIGWRLAQALRLDCRLVYVAPDTWLSDYAGRPPAGRRLPPKAGVPPRRRATRGVRV